MTYYIKLRHPKDARPTAWKNSWADDDLVTSISTFPAVAERCEQVAKVGGVVRIHRLRHGGEVEKVCCECQIASVTYAKNGIRVEFKNWRVVDLKPPVDRKDETGSSYEA